MKYVLLGFGVGLISLTAHAAEIAAYRCQANCLLASSDPKELRVFPVESRPFRSRADAYAQLGRLCLKESGGEYPIVSVVGAVEELEAHHSQDEVITRATYSHWSGSYGNYRREWASDRTYHWFESDEARIRVGPASKETHCEETLVEEYELVPVYEGGLTVGG